MKLSRELALALGIALSLVVGESQSPSWASVVVNLPGCSRQCFTDSLTRSKCDRTNEQCVCSDQVLLTNATACVLQSCTAKDVMTFKGLIADGCKEPIRDKSASYMIISNVLGTVSLLLVIQRFAFKLFAKQDLGSDDWFTLATIISGIPSTVINTLGVGQYALGRDAWTLSFDQLYNFGKFFYIEEVLYFLQVALMKLALVFFFLRIFPTTTVRRLLWGTIAFTIVFAVVFVFLGIFTCSPISYFWTRWDQEHTGRCIDINGIVWANAGINISIDVWMVAIPMWHLGGLRMHWKKKISVAIMFLLGAFVTIVSILRLRSIIEFGSDSMNPTWDYFEVSLWSCIEVNVGIWCVCLPSFRLLLVRLFPTLGSSTARTYAQYSNRTAETNRAIGPNATATSVSNDASNTWNLGKDQIACYKSYAVEVSDIEEVALVPLGNHQSRTRVNRLW